MPQIYPTPQTKDINILDCGVENEAYIKNFYQTHRYLPNLVICLSADDGEGGALITDIVADNGIFKHTQCFPLYYYESQSYSLQSSKDKPTYRRKDAIRDEALAEFNRVYAKFWCANPQYANSSIFDEKSGLRSHERGNKTKASIDEASGKLHDLSQKDEFVSITKESIFYYIYALLNHNGYKQKYKDNLSKMLPRIPYAKDFWAYEKLGRELANLHLQYESFAKCSRALAIPKDKISLFSGIFGTNSEAKSKDLLSELEPKDFTIKKMSFEKKGQKDIIIFNDKIAIINIPPKAYNYIVNGKSAIEWIMERYQVKIDKDSGIKNDPNLYECKSGALAGLNGGKYALYLLLSIIEMSVQSVEIIEAISELDFSEVEK